MGAVYPASVKTFSVKTNVVDDIDASHVNALQEEVVAIQTVLGTYPNSSAGGYSTVKARLDTVEKGPFPASQTAYTASAITVSATGSSITTNLATRTYASMTLGASAIILVTYGAWLSLNEPSSGTNDLRVGVTVSGSVDLGPSSPGWGNALYIANQAGSGVNYYGQHSGSKVFTAPAGTFTAEFQATKLNTSSVASVNYPSLTITALRWA